MCSDSEVAICVSVADLEALETVESDISNDGGRDDVERIYVCTWQLVRHQSALRSLAHRVEEALILAGLPVHKDSRSGPDSAPKAT